MKTRFSICVLFALIFALCFSGCASSSRLYYWGNYEEQVYSYLNGESRETQLRVLERDREKIETGGKAAPPGFYAHLGLLYAETGNSAMAVNCFRTEKNLFPEAAAFMDLLLARYGL